VRVRGGGPTYVKTDRIEIWTTYVFLVGFWLSMCSVIPPNSLQSYVQCSIQCVGWRRPQSFSCFRTLIILKTTGQGHLANKWNKWTSDEHTLKDAQWYLRGSAKGPLDGPGPKIGAGRVRSLHQLLSPGAGPFSTPPEGLLSNFENMFIQIPLILLSLFISFVNSSTLN